GLLRNRHVQIEADPRVSRTGSRGMNFVAVAILDDLDADTIGSLLGVVLVPRLCILLARNSNLRLVRRTHADIAAAIVYRDSRIPGNFLGCDVQVKVKTVSPLTHVAGEIFPGVVNANDDAQKTEKSQNKKNFASGNLRR